MRIIYVDEGQPVKAKAGAVIEVDFKGGKYNMMSDILMFVAAARCTLEFGFEFPEMQGVVSRLTSDPPVKDVALAALTRPTNPRTIMLEQRYRNSAIDYNMLRCSPMRRWRPSCGVVIPPFLACRHHPLDARGQDHAEQHRQRPPL